MQKKSEEPARRDELSSLTLIAAAQLLIRWLIEQETQKLAPEQVNNLPNDKN